MINGLWVDKKIEPLMKDKGIKSGGTTVNLHGKIVIVLADTLLKSVYVDRRPQSSEIKIFR